MATQMAQTDGVRRSRHASMPGQRSKNETWKKTVDEFQQTFVQQRPVKTGASSQSRARQNQYETQEMNETVANTGQSHASRAARTVSRNTEHEHETMVKDLRMQDKRRDRQYSDERRERLVIEDNDGYIDSDNRLRFSPTSKMISDSYYAGKQRKRKDTVGDRAADFVDDIVEGVRAILSPTSKRRSRSLSRMKASRTSETDEWSVSGVTGRRSSSGSRGIRAPQNTSVVNIYQEHLTEKVRSPRSRGSKTSGRRQLSDNMTRDTSQASVARTALSTNAAVQFHRADVRDEDDDIIGLSAGKRLSMRSASSVRRDIGMVRATTKHDLRYCVSDDDMRCDHLSADEDDALLRIRPVPGSGRSSRSRSGQTQTWGRKQDVRDPVEKERSTVTSADNGAYSTSVNVTSDAVNHKSSPECRIESPRKRRAPEPPTISRGNVTKVSYSDNDIQSTRTSNVHGSRQQSFDSCGTDRRRETATVGTYSSMVSLPNPTSESYQGSHSRVDCNTGLRSPVLTLTGPDAQRDIVHPVQAQAALTVYHNSPTILLRAKGDSMRNIEADVATPHGGTFSNEPLILADLNRPSDGSGPALTYPGYVVAENRSGTIYGTKPALNMDKSQMLNMYVFNKVGSPAGHDSIGYDGVDKDEGNKVMMSHDRGMKEVVINHKGTQTPSPVNTRVLQKQRQCLVPVSRATETHDTRQLRTRQPRSDGRHDRTDSYYEEIRSPVSEYVRHINSYSDAPHSPSVISVAKPRIIEERQLERSSNTIAPRPASVPNRNTTIHLADTSGTYDEITALDLSSSESDDGETETVTVEEKETRIAITLFEEIEFNTSSTPGGRVLPGGDRGVDIDQWWVPNKYETRVDRRRTKRVLINELVIDGDTLPLKLARDTADDRDTKGSPPSIQSKSEVRPSSQTTRTFVDLPDDSHYCSMTGASDKRSDVNGGSLLLGRQRHIDMEDMLVGKHPQAAVEQDDGSTAGLVILVDKTLSLQRTTGHGDVQHNQIDDNGYRRKTTEVSQKTGRPFRSSLTRQIPVQKRPIAFSRQRSLGSAMGKTRNTVDADIDRRTFYYPNDALSQTSPQAKSTPLDRQVSLPADFASIANSERQPLSDYNGQIMERNQARSDVARAPSDSAATEQMAEEGYISLDLFANASYTAPGVTEETATKHEPYDVDVQVGDVPVSPTPKSRPDDKHRRSDDTTGLPDHYPVDHTMSTRL